MTIKIINLKSETDNIDFGIKQNVPAANIQETPEHYMLSMAVPGFRKEDFKIEIRDDIISIGASKVSNPSVCSNDRSEYDYTSWNRSFLLPDDSEGVLAKAKYREGELFVRIPKGSIAHSKHPIKVYVY